MDTSGSIDWSPDSATHAFESLRNGNKEVYTASADGTVQARLTENPEGDWDPRWRPE